MASAYNTSEDDDQELIKNLALFLTNYLHNHLRLIENPDNQELLINAHLYLIKISTVEDREVFKICLEYWAKVSFQLARRWLRVKADSCSLSRSCTRRL